jgi:hypothetical protein
VHPAALSFGWFSSSTGERNFSDCFQSTGELRTADSREVLLRSMPGLSTCRFRGLIQILEPGIQNELRKEANPPCEWPSSRR